MALSHPLLDAAAPAYRTPSLVVAMVRPAPWVFLSRIEGHLDLSGARCVADGVRSQVMASTRMLAVFNDWTRMTDYEGQARILLTDMTRSLHSRFACVHFLLSSPAVAFGVRAANLVLHRLTVHRSIESFRAALDEAMRKPTPPQPR